MNRRNYLTGVFHTLIIAMFLLVLSGCGYKASPYYEEKAPESDENVEFIIKTQKQNHENNENGE